MAIVPLIPHRRVDDLAERIEQLMSDAERRGYGMFASILEMALMAARIQMQEGHDRAAKSIDPRDLWRPDN